MEGLRRGQFQEPLVGRRVPEKVGKLGGQFVGVQVLRPGALAVLNQEQELRGSEDNKQRVLDTLLKVTLPCESTFPDSQQGRFF